MCIRDRTNIGAVRFEALTGVIVAMTDPDWPGVSVKVVGATATLKFGMVLVWASTWVTSEMDLRLSLIHILLRTGEAIKVVLRP